MRLEWLEKGQSSRLSKDRQRDLDSVGVDSFERAGLKALNVFGETKTNVKERHK